MALRRETESSTDQTMTYEAFLSWADEDTLAEWVDGKVHMNSPVGRRHQHIVNFLMKVLSEYTQIHALGEVLDGPFQMKLAHSGREPDVLFVARAHLDRLKPTLLDGPADLVIEVVSPESAARDRGDKFYEYREAGIEEYWLIDPQFEQAEFYQNDKTSPSRPHATDLRMMRLDGATQGKVIVVSLVEQVARFYDNGKLVFWSYVTTGRIELPSPPGLHFAMNKASPVIFTSPEPRSSPFWFEPTPVKYAIEYADGGDFLHDAWWRNQFGPGTNLPHYDPIAFNGGSHGCINFPLKAMGWVYPWTQVGTPLLVY
jgi:Uma2 family endonuclease